MNTSILIKTVLAAAVGTVISAAGAEPPATDTQPVVVHGATPAGLIAPAWQQGHAYKFGDLASYDGWAFKAKPGSAHKRPDVASEVGWEKLNSCDDKSKGAVRCELGNQSAATDTTAETARRYETVKQEMSKGKPVNAASQ